MGRSGGRSTVFLASLVCHRKYFLLLPFFFFFASSCSNFAAGEPEGRFSHIKSVTQVKRRVIHLRHYWNHAEKTGKSIKISHSKVEFSITTEHCVTTFTNLDQEFDLFVGVKKIGLNSTINESNQPFSR